jgi:osmotically-inducible protein OsmY
MSARNNDRDFDRERQNYGRRPTRDYDRSYGERSRYYRYDDSDLENERYGRESEYDRYSRPTRRQYQTREGYGGEAFGSGRYNQSSDMNRSYPDVERYGRSYDDDWQNRKTWGRESQRYNYPSDYRSGSSYREHSGYGDYGRGEYDREYDQGERGWWDRTSDEVASWFGDEEAQQRRRMDRRREQFRGRGPKGYRRSDERIREDVNDRLSDDYYLDASDIEVAVSETLVTLTGTVDTRTDKRRAEDIAESVSGVTNVENRLRVKESSLDRTSGIETSGTTSTSITGTTSRSRSAGT